MPVMRPILAPVVLLALLASFGLGSCADATLAAGTIRGSEVSLDDQAGRLLGVDHGTRIRYSGAKRQHGFRVAAIGPGGEVVGVRKLGYSISDDPLEVDRVAVVTLEDIWTEHKYQKHLSVRYLEMSGSGDGRMSTFVEDLWPEEVGGTSEVSLGERVVEETEGLPIHTVRFANGQGEFQVEYFVE